MDGSQLPTEWTHLNKELVAGVSDSKKRDVSLQQSGTASKKGPILQKSEDAKMSKMSKIPDASENLTMAKASDSGTNV